MDTIITSKILLTSALPMLTALLVMFSGKKPNLREAWSLIGALLTFLSVLNLLPHILAGGSYEYTLASIYPGVNIKFHLDGLGIMFAGTASFLWILAGFYCIGYMRGLDEHAQTRFYVCYAVSVGAAMGAAFAGNLFTLYLFYEIVSIFTYPLVAHHQDAEGYAGARKYTCLPDVYLEGLFVTGNGNHLSTVRDLGFLPYRDYQRDFSCRGQQTVGCGLLPTLSLWFC